MAEFTAENLAVLLGMSLFFGLAFEDFFAEENPQRPGGIRTFPLLALTGAGCYALGSHGSLVFSCGLAIVGLLLFADYQANATNRQGGFVVPVCNVLAYLLGALAISQAPWVVVAVTVAATMLLAGRKRLHDIAHTVPLEEIFTAGQFLILTGVALPLLPDVPLAGMAELTPHRILLAVVVVSTLSYGSYLLTRYIRPRGATLLAATLGGLYSSTATTVVLARRRCDGDTTAELSAGIVLATAFMYVRLLVIVAVFDLALGRVLTLPLTVLFASGVVISWIIYRAGRGQADRSAPLDVPTNPLQLSSAIVFAALFVAVTLATNFARARFGQFGLDTLAALVGVTDIDPFVLSLAQGNTGAHREIAGAILIAASSNNVLKATYTFAFGRGRGVLQPILGLAALAAGSIVAALLV